MSRKVSTYRPSYRLAQLLDLDSIGVGLEDWRFVHGGCLFVARSSRFHGATATQVAAMNWASGAKIPPVMAVSHEKPGESDGNGGKPLFDGCYHRHYSHYAMAVVTLDCLGEAKPRKIKVYFCDISYHEHNAFANVDNTCKGTFVVPIVD